jgi:hypothetical protein
MWCFVDMSASSLSGLNVDASSDEATDGAGDKCERRRLAANVCMARALVLLSVSDIVAMLAYNVLELCWGERMFRMFFPFVSRSCVWKVCPRC